MTKSKTIGMVVSGIKEANRFLQPWRYLSEVAFYLAQAGHSVSIFTEQGTGYTTLPKIPGVAIQPLRSVRCPRWISNRELLQALNVIRPEIVIWSVGSTSLIYQDYPSMPYCVQIGIFSSPLYSLPQLARIGIGRLLRNFSLGGIHLLGALYPARLLRSHARCTPLQHLVTQTVTTATAVRKRFWEKPVQVIRPGIDALWLSPHRSSSSEIRTRLGIPQENLLFLYFGSPSPLRGLPVLIQAIARALPRYPHIQLVVLNRRREKEFEKETRQLMLLVRRLGLQPVFQMIDGLLSPESLREWCLACDIVALPFDLLPSDAPLSVLEAQALGKPILTTRLGCLPEMTQGHRAFLAEPANVTSLTQAILEAVESVTTNPTMASPGHPPPARTWEQVGEEWVTFIQSL